MRRAFPSLETARDRRQHADRTVSVPRGAASRSGRARARPRPGRDRRRVGRPLAVGASIAIRPPAILRCSRRCDASAAGFVLFPRFGPTGRAGRRARSGERAGRPGGARVSAAVGSRAGRRSVGQPVRVRRCRGRGRARSAAHRSLRGSPPATPNGFSRRRHGRHRASARACGRSSPARRDRRVARDDRGRQWGSRRTAAAPVFWDIVDLGAARIISEALSHGRREAIRVRIPGQRCVWFKRRPPTSTCWPTTSPASPPADARDICSAAWLPCVQSPALSRFPGQLGTL